MQMQMQGSFASLRMMRRGGMREAGSQTGSTERTARAEASARTGDSRFDRCARNDSQKNKDREKEEAIPRGMTERKARATEEAESCGMTTRKATAKQTQRQIQGFLHCA